MHVPDSVTKELTLSARKDHVWRALMDPELLVRWFPTEAADVDLRPGGTVRFVWESSRDEGVIDEVTPNARLVFRWRAEDSERPYTRVTVTLEDLVGGGTRLVLVEDGFSAFAEDERGDMVAGNDRGWDEELAELAALLEARAA